MINSAALQYSQKELLDWHRLFSDTKARMRIAEIGQKPERRVLYINSETPQPDRNSGSIDALNLMRILHEFGYRVTFIPESNFAAQIPYTSDLEQMGIQCVYFPDYNSVSDVLNDLGSMLEIVVLCRANIADKYLKYFREREPQAKIVFNSVDLHHLRVARQAQITGDSALKCEAESLKVTELNAIRNADATIVLSTAEIDLLRKDVPDAPLYLVPLLRDIPDDRTTPPPRAA